METDQSIEQPNASRPVRTVLITGAARRIGRALAEDLSSVGWNVAIHCNTSQADAEEIATEIRAIGCNCEVFVADLADENDVENLVPRVNAQLGTVTCLINNASLFEHDEAMTVNAETWDAHMSVNLRAPFFLTQAFVRQLPVGASGSVVNVIDQRVWNLGTGYTSYTLSKYGLWGLTQMLAQSFAPHVRVNAIGPGPTIPSDRQTADEFARQWQSTPLRRPIEASEICHAVRFILDAPSMTGQMIALDSGQHLGLGFVEDTNAV